MSECSWMGELQKSCDGLVRIQGCVVVCIHMVQAVALQINETGTLDGK